MQLEIEYSIETRELKAPFTISRGVLNEAEVLQVRVVDGGGTSGRGECYGVTYRGDTITCMVEQLERLRPAFRQGVDRRALIDGKLLPPGGARAALDAALWDLEAKMGLACPFAANRLKPFPVTTARSIGIGSLEDYARDAARFSSWPLLKIKLDNRSPLDAMAVVRQNAPHASLIVDPNQSWSVEELKRFAKPLADLGINLIEQPIPVGAQAGLDGWQSPIPLCADELVNTHEDLAEAYGRFKFVNIKLDKVGGLTAALELADKAQAAGFEIMVGCMAGTSLSMAPAMVLAQRCSIVDLDAPLLLKTDIEAGFEYRDGHVAKVHSPLLWG